MKYLLDTLPICEALSKRSGKRCKNYASKGKRVCRIHGGRSTGAKTKSGKLNQKTTNIKHGMYTSEVKLEARQLCEFLEECKKVLKDTNGW